MRIVDGAEQERILEIIPDSDVFGSFRLPKKRGPASKPLHVDEWTVRRRSSASAGDCYGHLTEQKMILDCENHFIV